MLILCFFSLIFPQNIHGSGATFPYPIYSVWGYEYNKTHEISLSYDKIGSGSGIKKIIARKTEFGASDAPLNKVELEKHNLIQFPAIIGAVVPVINIPEISKDDLKLSQETLSSIFSGTIVYWNDPKICALNPKLPLPNEKIILVYRSDKSGTTALFTTFLGEISSSFKRRVGVGKAVRWPSGIKAKGNSGIANYVKRMPYSIGYVNYSYALSNRLSVIQLENKAGVYVRPNIKSFSSAARYGRWRIEEHFNEWLINAPGKDSWPIAGASFIILAKEKQEVNKKVIAFFQFCFSEGNEIAETLSYIPIPKTLQDKIFHYFEQNGLTN